MTDVDAHTVLDRPTMTVTVEGYVATMTLNRPETMNAFDEAVHDDFLATVDALRTLDVRAAVLASTGKVFSAGGDFDFMLQAHHDLQFLLRHVDVGRNLVLTLLEVPYPIVAAVQGPAIGLGATVVLACDAVVASRNVVIADPHVRVGLAAGDGGCLFWPQHVGMLLARRYLLTGDRLDAERCYQLGLVSDLVDEPADVLPAASALAERMAALPPLAVQGTKRALANVMRMRAGEVLDLAFAAEVTSVRSDDLPEAIAAIREKRPPTYRGR
ncbi:MAG: enoyl-CoA hydratase/isomerase family protein [Actinomycetota bacterium]|nr:enoyl-CoA hydratase/isomerase family protein [Actinomycetota bacterium]